MGKGAAGEIDLDVRQLRGIKPLRKLLPLLPSLRDVGCERDRAGNRGLHYDQYVTLVLLMLFNPLIGSLRALRHAASVERVSRRLGVKRFSLGSFSESVRRFEPERLKEVVRQLCGDLSALHPVGRDGRLKDLADPGHALTAVDGTVLDSIAKATGGAFSGIQSKYVFGRFSCGLFAKCTPTAPRSSAGIRIRNHLKS